MSQLSVVKVLWVTFCLISLVVNLISGEEHFDCLSVSNIKVVSLDTWTIKLEKSGQWLIVVTLSVTRVNKSDCICLSFSFFSFSVSVSLSVSLCLFKHCKGHTWYFGTILYTHKSLGSSNNCTNVNETFFLFDCLTIQLSPPSSMVQMLLVLNYV